MQWKMFSKCPLFMPPISPIKDKTTGRTVKSATLTPLRTINLEEIYKLIKMSLSNNKKIHKTRKKKTHLNLFD